MATIPQMLNRMQWPHRVMLECLSAGKPYITPTTSASEFYGFNTAGKTLLRWGCIENVRAADGTWRKQITARGAELLAARSARQAA